MGFFAGVAGSEGDRHQDHEARFHENLSAVRASRWEAPFFGRGREEGVPEERDGAE